MLDAKNLGDMNKMIEIQSKLDLLTGSVTKNGIPMNLEWETGNSTQPPFETDNINSSWVVPVSDLKGISQSFEQRGSTASRIWVVYAYDNVSVDAMGIKYSDDNGITWLEYIPYIPFSLGNRINPDEIDTEIIENTTGDKFLWIVFGYTNGGGDKVIGVTISKISGGIDLAGYTLNWPGSNSNSRYYKPRICSDNAQFAGVPWVYIVACYDSTSGVPPLRSYSGKVVRCNAPFTVTPAFTYKPEPVTPTSLRLSASVYYDIAYFRNSNDSIAFVASGFQDTSSVNILVSSIGSFTSSVSNVGTIHPNFRRRSHCYIASNGAYNRLMIVSRTQFNPLDWDIEYFTSANGSRNWSGSNVDFRVNNSGRPDIKERRNSPGTFYCSYVDISQTFDSVAAVVCNNYTWGTPVLPLNHIDASITTPPRPGFRYSSGDSSLVIWSENTGTGTHIWASGGTSGTIVSTGSNGSVIPERYELFQNYPNPFNPTTNIKFHNVESNNVELKIYNSLGKEVAVLVNETLPAGEYNYVFNAAGFSSGVYFYKLTLGSKYSQLKKMVLIK